MSLDILPGTADSSAPLASVSGTRQHQLTKYLDACDFIESPLCVAKRGWPIVLDADINRCAGLAVVEQEI